MENNDDEILENAKTEDQPESIEEFIERKKLQNRILGDIISKIKQQEINHKSQTISKKKKS